MVLDEYTTIIWKRNNKKHYTGLGYKYAKQGTKFTVKTSDLSPSSSYKINVKCDYCGAVNRIIYHGYTKSLAYKKHGFGRYHCTDCARKCNT